MSGERLRGKVVVITGAASGIGRAAAYAFARRGASVVLAARREEEIRKLAAECEALGAAALAVPTDMTDSEAVLALARRAIEVFGRIDVWINNAAVALYARFGDAPAIAFRQVIETNLLGYAHGARAALPWFCRQGTGVLINNASILGKVARPYVASYIAAKFGIVGLSSALRQEMLLEAPGVQVCTILPSSIDTPIYHYAANWMDRTVAPLLPIYRAERVAEAMVALALRPRREVVVGTAGRLIVGAQRLLPGLTEIALARMVRGARGPGTSARPVTGNLFAPIHVWSQVSGGFGTSEGLLPLLSIFVMYLRTVAAELADRLLRRG